MPIKVTKTIRNTQADSLVALCKKSFKKQILTWIVSTAVCVLCGFVCFNIDLSLQVPIQAFLQAIISIGAGLGFLVSFISLIMLLGNMSGGGSVLARLDCKTDKDWLDFAEHHTWLSETITLSKKLELEHKEIIEVLLESTELRCQDVETKEIGVIVLNKPLKEFFTIRRVTYLGYGEATIDLSGERPIMFVNLDKKNKEG